jgi:hypothetical protein
MTSLGAVCGSCGYGFSTDAVLTTVAATIVRRPNIASWCPCCGAKKSVQNGACNDIGGVVSNSENTNSSRKGTSVAPSNCVISPGLGDAEAVLSARRLRSKLRQDTSKIFQSGILYVLATIIMLFQQSHRARRDRRARPPVPGWRRRFAKNRTVAEDIAGRGPPVHGRHKRDRAPGAKGLNDRRTWYANCALNSRSGGPLVGSDPGVGSRSRSMSPLT